jgi:hypothetical protein
MPNVSNSCPHSHMKRLDVEGWIKQKQKHNAEVKVECATWKIYIKGLTTNHSLAPLLEQERMQVLDAKGMELSSNINLMDVS